LTHGAASDSGSHNAPLTASPSPRTSAAHATTPTSLRRPYCAARALMRRHLRCAPTLTSTCTSQRRPRSFARARTLRRPRVLPRARLCAAQPLLRGHARCDGPAYFLGHVSAPPVRTLRRHARCESHAYFLGCAARTLLHGPVPHCFVAPLTPTSTLRRLRPPVTCLSLWLLLFCIGSLTPRATKTNHVSATAWSAGSLLNSHAVTRL